MIGFGINAARARNSLDVPLKLVSLALLIAGTGFTLYSVAAGLLKGDDAGAVRLAFLAALPILLVVIYRLVIVRLAHVSAENARSRILATVQTIEPSGGTAANVAASEREALALLKALGLMIEHELPEDIPQQIAIAIATAVKSDTAALLAMDDAEYADVIAAYDNIQQKPIAAMALKLDEQPTLLLTVRERTQRALTTDRNLNELVDLYTRLDIQRVGPPTFSRLSATV